MQKLFYYIIELPALCAIYWNHALNRKFSVDLDCREQLR